MKRTLNSSVPISAVLFGNNLLGLGGLGGAIQRRLSPIRWAATHARVQLNETLLTIAEVSVGFAGFASIVTVLGKRSDRDTIQDIVRLRIMLVYSLSVLFLCILPAILRGYAFPETAVWRVSCFVLAVTALVLILTVRRSTSRDLLQSGRYSRAYVTFYAVLTLAPPLACGLAAAGVGSQVASATYVLSLALLLLAAAVVFVRLVLSFMGRSSPAAQQADEADVE